MQGQNSSLSESTLVLNGSIKIGNANEIDTKGKTIGEIVSLINAQSIPGITASIKDGKFTVTSTNGVETITVSGDFARITGMDNYIVSKGIIEEKETTTFIQEITQLTEEEALAQGYTVIKTAEDLNNIRNDLSGKYILMDDIDLSSYENWEAIGDYGNEFTGIFDGNGYVITNLTINNPDNDYQGLFGRTAAQAEIRNVGLENVNVSGNNYVGGLVGNSSASSDFINNCYVTGTVTGKKSVGGLIGTNKYNAIIDCFSTAVVSGQENVGGLIGEMDTSSQNYIANSYTTGNVTGDIYVGGLVGNLKKASILNSYTTGNITGNSYTGKLIGKFFVENFPYSSNDFASVIHCYATGELSTDGYNTNELVGQSYGRIIYEPEITKPHQLTEEEALAQGYTIIKTAEDLNNIRNKLYGKYILMNDIDLSSYENWEAIGDDNNYFGGIFNGNGYVIKNLTINKPDSNYQGLFGKSRGEIRNVGLENVNVSGNNYVGGLVGYNLLGEISDCYVTGTVTGKNYVGGLIGDNNGGKIYNSFSKGSISGESDIGGIVGWNSGSIINTYSTAKITGDYSTGEIAGYDPNEATIQGPINKIQQLTESEAKKKGYTIIETAEDLYNIRNNLSGKYILMDDIDLSSYENWEAIGDNDNEFTGIFDGNGYVITNLTINNPNDYYQGLFGVSDGEIRNTILTNVNINGDSRTGGLVGKNEMYIYNCHVSGNITGGKYSSNIGGLVGENSSGHIYNCSTSTTVVGKNGVGGLIGQDSSGILFNNSSSGSVSGNMRIGGLIGWNTGSNIFDCLTTSTIKGQEDTGGLIGWTNSSTNIIKNSIWDIKTTGQTNCISNIHDKCYIYDTNGITPSTLSEKLKLAGFDEDIWDFSGETPIQKIFLDSSESEQENYASITGSVDTRNFSDSPFWGQKSGTLIFSDGTEINISATDTRSDVLLKIQDAGFTVEITTDGKIKIISKNLDSFYIKSDTSGFSEFYGLMDKDTIYSGGITTTTETVTTGEGGDGGDEGGDHGGGEGGDHGGDEGGDHGGGEGGDHGGGESGDHGGGSTIDPNPYPPFNISGLITKDISNIRIQVEANSSDTAALFFDTTFIFDEFSLDFSTTDTAQEAFKAVKALSSAVNEKNTDIGIYLSRLDSVYNRNIVKTENLESSYSTVTDADIAVETQKYIKYTLLQETAQALQAQAHAIQQKLVLDFLENI